MHADPAPPPLVVLTDFFAPTNRALDYAAALALPLRARLVLLHVLHDGLLAPAEYNSRRARQGEHQAIAALEQLAAQQPVPTRVDVSEDFLPDATREAVRRHQPLLLVLGRPDAATAAVEVVSSAALDVLRHAPHPLLLVPAEGWGAYPPRRLLLAVDGDPFRLTNYHDVLRRLLRATAGTLDVVHVGTNDAPSTSATVLQTIYANNLVDSSNAPPLHQVRQATAAGGILQEATRLRADLVVVVARRHSLLGGLFHDSVTARLLRESPIPVLLLPAKD